MFRLSRFKALEADWASRQGWLATQPAWLEPRSTPPFDVLPIPKLGKGERAAIALAQEVHAALLLIGDRAGAAAARALGLKVTGTLGVLARAAAQGLSRRA